MMKTFQTTMLASLVLVFAAPSTQAGDVAVKGVHLCCGQCVKIVGKALNGVKGVTNPACDRDTKTVSFTATDDKTAGAAIKALAKAGFHGTATHGEKKIAFPKSGAKKGDKSDKITLAGVHLCCGACVSTTKKIFKGFDGVDKVDVDRAKKTVTLSGSDINVVAAVKALNKGGFHGRVEKLAESK